MSLRRLALALPLAACAHASSAPAPTASRRLDTDGAVVRAEPDPLTGLSHYDAATLFHLASEAERQGKTGQAIALYERFLVEFPHSRSLAAARFNLGLAYEKERRFADAAPIFQAIIEGEAPADEAERRTYVDAHYRLAVSLGQLGAWWDAVGALDHVLALEPLSDLDRLEAMVGRGIAIRSAGEPESADIALAAALRFHQELSQKQAFYDGGLAAEAAFHMGEIAVERYAAVALEMPVELLRERLEKKCELLLSAQHRMLRAIRLGDAHTAAAAGYKIGWLYENLYDVILALDLPPELDVDQAEVYREEVRGKVGILVEKAIVVYEKTLAVGRTAETAGAWIARIEQALARLRDIFLGDAPT